MFKLEVADLRRISNRRFNMEHRAEEVIMGVAFVVAVVLMLLSMLASDSRELKATYIDVSTGATLVVTEDGKFLDGNKMAELDYDISSHRIEPWGIVLLSLGGAGLIGVLIWAAVYSMRQDDYRRRLIQDWVDEKDKEATG